jgi:hypothetical protein
MSLPYLKLAGACAIGGVRIKQARSTMEPQDHRRINVHA